MAKQDRNATDAEVQLRISHFMKQPLGDDPTPYARHVWLPESLAPEQDQANAGPLHYLAEPAPSEHSNPAISSSSSSPTEDDSDSGFSPITSQVGSESGLSALSPESTTRIADEAIVEELMSWARSWLKDRLYPDNGPRALADSTGTPLVDEGGGASTETSSKRRRVDKDSSEGNESNNGHGGIPGNHKDADHKRDNNDDAKNEQEGEGDKSVRPCDNLRLLACPFYKRNPRKYGQPEWRSCKSAGFKTLHRLKEHIYRRHRKPRYQCKRCQDDFKREDALDLHCAQPVACQSRPAIIQNGINDTQERAIRSRKLAKKNETEEEKWRRMYGVIFPDDTDCPSPYHTPDEESKEFDLVEEYRSFLAQELPPLVRRQLPDILMSDPGNELREQIVSMVGVLANQLYDTFRNEVGHSVSQDFPPTSTDHSTDEFHMVSQSMETLADRDTTQGREGPEQAVVKSTQIDDLKVPPGFQVDPVHDVAYHGPDFDWTTFFHLNEDMDETNVLQDGD
ncbi:hypothetical protein BGZ61DRAFT_594334 [Ilyonectria robusta]|uniref:uncharacterized protein n=1 Tax=Ilyonectria robusta TaxID=1079257 RepID=UPI001E8CFDBE|nr:uncharacterized protein BGZ61DRAFT_594334 [Ilyonectria robusta]KAH8656933.1 hypothetical protein BGZ61DRAFT_594334 [Ilyonectria robusta]